MFLPAVMLAILGSATALATAFSSSSSNESSWLGPGKNHSLYTGMLTTAKGTSMIVENIFENRYKYTNELKRMGAKITTEGKVAIVKGTKKLVGTTVEATDLRGGATLVLAGLVAKGKTTVTNIEHILRGYEALDNKLNKIGANIQLKNSLV